MGGCTGLRPNRAALRKCLLIRGRYPSPSRRTERVTIVAEQNPKLGLTNASRVCQHRVEHGLQFARRTTDDAQDLRGRGLLLQGFTKFARALLLSFEQAHVLD